MEISAVFLYNMDMYFREVAMMDYNELVIETKRLKLVPITLEYIDQIFIYFDQLVTRYMYPAPPKEYEDSIPFINSSIKNMREGTDYVYVILKKENDEFIGCGGMHRLDQEYPEFGIWTKTSAHGNHYGFEAVEATYHYFIGQYKGFLYPVDKDNIPSKLIPLRLGGTIHRTFPQENQSGVMLDIEEYLVLSKPMSRKKESI